MVEVPTFLPGMPPKWKFLLGWDQQRWKGKLDTSGLILALTNRESSVPWFTLLCTEALSWLQNSKSG